MGGQGQDDNTSTTSSTCSSPDIWECYYLGIKAFNIWDVHIPDNDPAKWKRSIDTLLQGLLKTGSGSALLRSIRDEQRWIRIRPLDHAECNAHGGQMPKMIIDGKTFYGMLAFNPDVYMSGSPCYKRMQRSFGHQPDQVLFHELLHAHRGASDLVSAPVALHAGLAGYQDDEEFLAVVLTNIYISETRGRGMRADYYSYDELKGPLATSLGFFQSSPQVLPILKKFSTDQEFLFKELAKVKAAFNPIAAMNDHPALVEKLSGSKEALAREKTGDKQAAAELARIRNDRKLDKENDEAELRKALATLPKDLAFKLAQAALTFLPK